MTKRTCSIVENGKRCPDFVHGRGWCKKHYLRWYKHGDPLFTLAPHRGMHYTMQRGYVKLYRPGHALANPRGWVLEHRLVAYEAGLLVDCSDIVHHRDDDKQNNDPTNLEVMTQAEHARLHAVGGVAAEYWRARGRKPKPEADL